MPKCNARYTLFKRNFTFATRQRVSSDKALIIINMKTTIYMLSSIHTIPRISFRRIVVEIVFTT